MKTMRTLLAALGCLCLLTTALHAQVPNLLNYQGRVAVDGVNFDGQGQFKFALVNADGTTTYWTNSPDTTPADGIPDTPVTLTVAKGLYSVLLGDTSRANMAAVPANVFANGDVRLRVWFDDGIPAHGSQRLDPDSRITPSPYLADGAVTSGKFGSDLLSLNKVSAGFLSAGTGGNIGVGTTTPTAKLHIFGNTGDVVEYIGSGDDAIGRLKLSYNATGRSSLLTSYATDGYKPLQLEGGTIVLNSDSGGNVGIGTTQPAAKLHVAAGPNSTPQLILSTTNPGTGLAIELLRPPASGKFNWQFGSNINTNNAFSITPSTVADGTLFSNPSITILQNGYFGIGTPVPTGILDVQAPEAVSGAGSPVIIKAQKGAANNIGGNLLLSSGDNGVNSSNGYIAFGIGATVPNGSGFFSNNERMRISNNGNVGIGTTTPGQKLDVNGAIRVLGGNAIYFDNPEDTGSATLYFDGSELVSDRRFWIDGGLIVNTGSVGIGTTTPQAKLDVLGSLRCRTDFIMREEAAPVNQKAWRHFVDSATFYMATLDDSNGNENIFFRATRVGQTISTINFEKGNVGIGTTVPNAKLEIGATRTDTPGGQFFTIAAVAKAGFRIDTQNAFNIDLYNGAIWTNPVTIQQNSGNVGIGATNPAEKLVVAGNIKITGPGNMLSTPKLAITGGSDVAEPFDIAGEDIPAGSVVVIDEAHPGHLKLSDQPYDARVAGIVSGAGGVQPGLTLSQQGVLEGRHQVALVGRVYAQADATDTPIHPGDLLTTSSTPGHLMRATDRDRAQGAILGKAMTPLEGGTGLVLVLVTLQ